MRSHYEVLGISRTATPSEVKAAYKRRAKETHPDTGGSATEFALVRQAYQVLSSPLERRGYDRTRIREHSERYWYAYTGPTTQRATARQAPEARTPPPEEDGVDRLLDVAVKIGRPVFWLSQKIGDFIESLFWPESDDKAASRTTRR